MRLRIPWPFNMNDCNVASMTAHIWVPYDPPVHSSAVNSGYCLICKAVWSGNHGWHTVDRWVGPDCDEEVVRSVIEE